MSFWEGQRQQSFPVGCLLYVCEMYITEMEFHNYKKM